MTGPGPSDEVRWLRWEFDELRQFVMHRFPRRRWVRPVLTTVAILLAFGLGHSSGESDCAKVAAGIVASGDYVPGLKSRQCVGEEDDPRVAALLAMHDAGE